MLKLVSLLATVLRQLPLNRAAPSLPRPAWRPYSWMGQSHRAIRQVQAPSTPWTFQSCRNGPEWLRNFDIRPVCRKCIWKARKVR